MTEHIAICVPHRGESVFQFTKSLMGLMYHCGVRRTPLAFIEATSSIGAFGARNICLDSLEATERSMNINFGWVFWLDDDLIFPPNALERLLAHKRDIVGATYVRRSAPFDVLGHGLTGRPIEVNEGLLEMAGMPTGCLLVRREVFRGMRRPYFRVQAIEETGATLGEDYVFCSRARELGFQVWLDVDLSKEIGHVGQKALWIEKDAYGQAA